MIRPRGPVPVNSSKRIPCSRAMARQAGEASGLLLPFSGGPAGSAVVGFLDACEVPSLFCSEAERAVSLVSSALLDATPLSAASSPSPGTSIVIRGEPIWQKRRAVTPNMIFHKKNECQLTTTNVSRALEVTYFDSFVHSVVKLQNGTSIWGANFHSGFITLDNTHFSHLKVKHALQVTSFKNVINRALREDVPLQFYRLL